MGRQIFHRLRILGMRLVPFFMAVFDCITDMARKEDLWENFVNLEGFCKNSTKMGAKFLHPLEEIYIFFVYEKAGQMLY